MCQILLVLRRLDYQINALNINLVPKSIIKKCCILSLVWNFSPFTQPSAFDEIHNVKCICI